MTSVEARKSRLGARPVARSVAPGPRRRGRPHRIPAPPRIVIGILSRIFQRGGKGAHRGRWNQYGQVLPR